MTTEPTGKDQDPSFEEGQLYRFAWIFYLVMALVGVFWIGFRHRDEGGIPMDLFVGSEWWFDLALGAAAGAALQAAWWLVERASLTARSLGEELRRRLGPIGREEVVGLAVLSGFSEEFLFRGAVQGSWGFVIATLLFAGLHVGPGATLRLWGVFALIAGSVFGGLMLWRGNLVAPVMAHVVVNAVGLWRVASQEPAVPPT